MRGEGFAAKVRSSSKGRVNALDGIRTLAILAVFVYHANATWLPAGLLGVTMFFVLSGYLITGGLVRQLEEDGRINLISYFTRRLRRLWPAMLVTIGGVAILALFFQPGLLTKMYPDVVPSALFYDNLWYIFQQQSYFEASGLPSPLTHFWYLGVLVQFYIAWPFVLWIVHRFTPSLTIMRRVVAALGIASLILMMVLYVPGEDPSRVYYGTDTRLAELAVGAWLSFVVPLPSSKGAKIPRHRVVRRIVASVPSWSWNLVVLACIAALFLMCRYLNGSSDFLFYGGLFIAALITALLIAALVLSQSFMSWLLGLAPFRVIGSRSFSLYLWHYPLLLIMNPATRTMELAWWGWLIEFVIIAGVTELSYRFIEEKTSHGEVGEFFSSLRHSFGGTLRTHILPLGAAVVFAIASVVIICVGPGYATDLADRQTEELEQARSQAEFESATFSDVFNYAQDLVRPWVAQIFEGANIAVANGAVYTVDPETGATDAPVTLIGDSVALGCADQFAEIFPNGYIDAEISRQLSTGADLYQQAVDNGHAGDVVVFALGTNGRVTADDVRANIEAAGGRRVLLVNNRMPAEYRESNNEIFEQVAAEYSTVEVVDWYSYSAGHDDWFWDDGTHLRPEGAEAYILMLRHEIVGQ